MSAKNHFVIWKGVRSGPFSKEVLEKEFAEGRMGLVRTVQAGGTIMTGAEFVADLEIRRKEDELEEQLRLQALQTEAAQKQAEDARQQAERQREEDRQKLDEALKNRAGKTTPPPIPDVNPWAPQTAPPAAGPSQPGQRMVSAGLSWWNGSGPVITSSLLCLVCLLSGQIFRELTAIAAIGLGVALVVRKRTTSGLILIGTALLAYGLGFLLSELVHEYISKNYPN